MVLIIYNTMVLRPFKLKQDSSLQNDSAFTLREKKKDKKASFLLWTLCNVRNGNVFMPIQQGCQKKSENLFCIELSNFFYPDEILVINLSHYYNLNLMA